MKAAIIAGCVVLSVLHAPGAHAAQRPHVGVGKPQVITTWSTMLPPAEYDKPYTGDLRIWVIASKKELREHYCAWTAAHQENWAGVACTSPPNEKKPYCEIYVGTDEILKAQHGLTRSVALRHELGHCNGWGKDHASGKKISVEAKVDYKLPANTKWIKAYPPLVCLTPDGDEEPCSDRTPFWPVDDNPWANSISVQKFIRKVMTQIGGCLVGDRDA